MSKHTTNQTNYQIVQTGGKLEMNTQGVSSVQDALGYSGTDTKLQKLFLQHFGEQRLRAIRSAYAERLRKAGK